MLNIGKKVDFITINDYFKCKLNQKTPLGN